MTDIVDRNFIMLLQKNGLTLVLRDAQCSTRIFSLLSGSGQRAISPAAKSPGALVSRNAFMQTP